MGFEHPAGRARSTGTTWERTGALPLLALLVTATGGVGCAGYRPDPEVPDLDGLVEDVAAKNDADALSGSTIAGPAESDILAFCDQVARHGGVKTIGCLPLPMRGRGGGAPTMSALGEELADHVAEGLADAGFEGWALGTSELSTRMAEMSVAPVALYTLPSVARNADRLGVDAVVFGTIDRQDGGRGVDVLRIHLTAYDLLEGRAIGDRRMEIPSNHPGARRSFALAEMSSVAWTPGDDWPSIEALADLDTELRVAVRILAGRVVEQLSLDHLDGAIYVPPADSEGFVGSVARLRGAQRAYAKELDRRFEVSIETAERLDMDAGVVLDDIEFPDMRAAESYLVKLQESLHASSGARFCQSVADMLTEELRPIVSPRQVIRDLGFTKWSDAELVDVEGWIATGGLARSKKARNMLKEEGIELVISTRFERLGANYGLRVVGLDLGTENLAASTYVRIDGRFTDELGAALQAELPRQGDGRLGDASAAARRDTWESVYARTKSGVVRLVGSTGDGSVSGTGFVVTPGGLVVTNSHVVATMTSSAPGGRKAIFADGTETSFELLADEPFWDLAVLRVATLPPGTHVFELADDARAAVGAEVAVLGHPKGTRGQVFAPGHLSSLAELVPTLGERRSFMYTCPTRGGNSGSPVIYMDGTVAAVNSHSLVGDVSTPAGSDAGQIRTELTGFALGAPASEAKRIVATLR
jgi:S1-C subfamily serine protease